MHPVFHGSFRFNAWVVERHELCSSSFWQAGAIRIFIKRIIIQSLHMWRKQVFTKDQLLAADTGIGCWWNFHDSRTQWPACDGDPMSRKCIHESKRRRVYFRIKGYIRQSIIINSVYNEKYLNHIRYWPASQSLLDKIHERGMLYRRTFWWWACR